MDAAGVAGAVVRIRDGEDVIGGGFVVGAGLIATCAHVVADAIGVDPYSPTAPNGAVLLDFPLAGDARFEAVVERWAPIATDGTGDVALLRLTAAPPDTRMPPLRRIDRLWDHGFRVLGFPASAPAGVWSSGLIRGEQSTRWFQLQSTPGEHASRAAHSAAAASGARRRRRARGRSTGCSATCCAIPRAREFRARTRGSSAATIETVLRRAHSRGEIDADTVTRRQREAGPALLRLHFLTHDGPLPDDVIVEIVDEVVLPLLRHGAATSDGG